MIHVCEKCGPHELITLKGGTLTTPITSYPTKEIADRLAGIDRIACVELEVTEGQGL